MLTGENRRFNQWLAALEARHLRDLTFSEVARALRALSSIYVERRRQPRLRRRPDRSRQARGVRSVLRPDSSFDRAWRRRRTPHGGRAESDNPGFGVWDGSGWRGLGRRVRQIASGPRRRQTPWALSEARRTYDEFGLAARVRRVDLGEFALPPQPLSLVAAFTLNELTDSARDALLTQALNRGRDYRDRGNRPREPNQLLVVEPVAGFVAPWWDRWKEAIAVSRRAIGRVAFPRRPPPLVAKLDRAAGLDHRVLTARSLWL